MIRREQCGQIVPAATPPPPPPPQAVVEVPKQQSRGGSGGGGGWMVVDCGGRAAVLNVDKHAIMERVGIHGRDLRILDPLLSYPSAILVRDAAIILNLEHIKAIITAEEVFLRNPSDENVIPMVEQLKRLLPLRDTANVEEAGEWKDMVGDEDEDESPFELQVLEVTLEGVCSYLAARTTELENAAYPALDELTYKVTSRNLDRVRKIKSAMTRLYTRVQKVRDEIEQLLDDDDDMADLYLSRKFVASSSPSSKSGNKNWFPTSPTTVSRISKASRASVVDVRGEGNDVEEVEMLLEAYFSQIDGTLNKLNALREYVDDTEDYINIQIDSRRNQLIQLELFLNAALLAVSFFSLVTGIFGTNIPYKWNHGYSYMFLWVLVGSGVISILTFGSIVSYARYKGLLGS